MDESTFGSRATGRLIPTIHGVRAFVPHPLPPPRLDLARLLPVVSRASTALGQLNGLGRTLSNPYLLIRPLMRREAVASSRIEGTVTTLSQLFLFELGDEDAPGDRTGDAREVWNYVRALQDGLVQLQKIPVSIRLLRDCHRTLLTGVGKARGANIIPGELKRDQNWIAGRTIQMARFVPPPPQESEIALGLLEKYINEDDPALPLIVRLALIHYQFEAIHPFPDGNGRVGRLLIPLILCDRKEMTEPLLYLSPYFERHYDDYIDKMLEVSRKGAWESWIEFFLEGIVAACGDSVSKIERLLEMRQEYLDRVQKARSSALLSRLVDMMFETPAITVPVAAQRLQLTYKAALANLEKLVSAGLLERSAEAVRPRFYAARRIIDLLSD